MLSYAMTLIPVVQDSVIGFAPRLPRGTRLGDVVAAGIADYGNCFWSSADHESVSVELLPSRDANQGARITVRINDAVTLRTAWVRVGKITAGAFVPQLFRVEATVNGRHGYLTPEGLELLGFGGQ